MKFSARVDTQGVVLSDIFVALNLAPPAVAVDGSGLFPEDGHHLVPLAVENLRVPALDAAHFLQFPRLPRIGRQPLIRVAGGGEASEKASHKTPTTH